MTPAQHHAIEAAKRLRAIVDGPLFQQQMKRIGPLVEGLLAVDGPDYNQKHLDMAWLFEQCQKMQDALQQEEADGN